MDERHDREQYFFDAATVDQLAGFLAPRAPVCCICAPSLGRHLDERGVDVSILDLDERFADLGGFVHYDLTRPRWLGADYGVIVCDPPFFNVSLSQLFAALRTLSQNRFDQPLLVSYLKRREHAFLRAFSDFQLSPTGYEPSYETVAESEKNRIEFYSNLSDDELARLRGSAGA